GLQKIHATLRDQPPAWHGLPGAVIALGDSSYGDTFCGAGEQIRELYAELGIREVLPMLRLDASETVTPEVDAEPWLAELATARSAWVPLNLGPCRPELSLPFFALRGTHP